MDSSFLIFQRNECVSVYVSPVIDCRSNQAVWWTAFISKKVISYSNKSYFIYLSSFSLCRSWGSEVLNSQCMNLDWGCTQNMWKLLAAKGKKRVHHPGEAAPGRALFNLLSLIWPRSPEMWSSSGVTILILGHNKTLWQNRACITSDSWDMHCDWERTPFQTLSGVLSHFEINENLSACPHTQSLIIRMKHSLIILQKKLTQQQPINN